MITKPIADKAEFTHFVNRFQKSFQMPFAFGIGVTYKDSEGNTIANKWLTVNIKQNLGAAAAIMHLFGINLTKNKFCYKEFGATEISLLLNTYFKPFDSDKPTIHENIEALKTLKKIERDNHRNGTNVASVVLYADESILTKEKIQNIGDAHFRLGLMSRLHYKPNTLCLDQLFSVLPTIVWAKNKPYTVDEWNADNHWATAKSNIDLLTDKIPILSWGAPIPKDVRMPNPLSARLGAYLSPGTTIMHYGFVNFNAGTLGKAMVEGTIAAGITIDDGSDIGKGGGFLGTLSGGNTTKLSAGKDCLIGALAECGVVLGDNCVVATGTCFTQNTPFVEITENGEEHPRKASYFNGKSNLTFRRNAKIERMEVIHKGNKAMLNPALHS